MDFKQLSDKRNKLTYDLRAMLDKWEADNNKPTDQFDTRANGLLKEQCEKLEAELDQCEAQITRAQANERVAKREADLQKPVYNTRSDAKASERNDSYFERFSQALLSGNRTGLERVIAERTAVTTIDSDVNGAVPEEWQKRIVEKINQFNVMRQLCPVRNVAADQKVIIGGVLPTAYQMTEGSAITEDAAFTVANATVGDYTFGVNLNISKQWASDAIGGMEYVARKGGEAIGNFLETEYLVGTGSSAIPGLLSNTFTTTAVDSGGSTLTITSDQLIDMTFALSPQYRQGASFMMSDALLKVVRKIKDTAGLYIWKPAERYSDIRDGMPTTILGHPVYISPAFPSATTAAATIALLGNFANYEIYDRDGGASVFVDPYGLSTSLANRVVVSHRTSGVCVNLAAFVRYTV